ncbi:MAG: hypothetical protein EAZ78_14940 [Oscillatoriales cyanobacterium]|uniref:Alpha/beta hydrolase n=1 Tax=Microcoleus anatoxicus PTRS2 TaxID=2705321 RepID=A0ABU8YT24_9CYAN|nr:MAG: hypothetical protein EA000_05480 [Oscillatoriales cyanobacterium]TAD98711.1 MAG: hypothetical protein EAZ96_24100 [Oscillatoriales cyanobacterium]TAE02345.1 MAG: hypothetical protein EAZ98_01795 [Oscillatoriales cyanobacterium]TAF02578.1 MAG: hypothetical protein EAZ78_14940 [Oscillatoriales cyanobacterium]TAF37985.1 MAG: hypothetical protein EAZ68_13715 [Oscillatoriales cyanobacterium]
MRLVICPGIHDPKLTDGFLAGLSEVWGDAELRPNTQTFYPVKIFPAHKHLPFSAIDIFHFLCSQELAGESLVFVSFSAGVAGAIGAAWMWQQIGGKVAAFIALDGWGVPLGGTFPIHRISHDRFTHWSSAILGSGGDSFYAHPPVEHLDLWRSPQTVQGWQISQTADRIETAKPATAATFLVHLLKRYGVQSVV